MDVTRSLMQFLEGLTRKSSFNSGDLWKNGPVKSGDVETSLVRFIPSELLHYVKGEFVSMWVGRLKWKGFLEGSVEIRFRVL